MTINRGNKNKISAISDTSTVNPDLAMPSDFIKKINNQVAEQLNTGVIVLNASLNIVMWNHFMVAHSDKSPESVIGRSIFEIFTDLPQSWLKRKISSVLQLNTPSFCSWQQRQYVFKLRHTRPITTDFQFMAQNCTFLPIDIDNAADHICILIEDATDACYYQGQLRKTLDELALMNRFDGLIQIYNRKYWQETLEQEHATAHRCKKELTLIMFDLDHFKRLNDTYGHQGGDKVLIDVGAAVKALLRTEDVFGRYGGEEFAIILPETDVKGAMILAERICQNLANTPLAYKDKMINISVSIGVSSLDLNDNNYEKLIADADLALYAAKSKGRNQVCLSPNSKLS